MEWRSWAGSSLVRPLLVNDMDGTALQDLVKEHVAEQVLPFARRISELEKLLEPFAHRIAELELQVQQLRSALGWETTKETRLGSHQVESSSLARSASNTASHSPVTDMSAPGFLALSDEALSLVLSYLPLRSPFVLQQGSRAQRNDFCTRGHLIWTCISEFVSVPVLRSDLTASAAASLYHWVSRTATVVSASDDDLVMLSEDCVQPDEERQVTYEICLEGCVAISMSRSYLSAVYFNDGMILLPRETDGAKRSDTMMSESAQAAVSSVREVLQGAECRLCRRSSTGFRSEGSGGHTNRYEVEFVIPIGNVGSCDQLRLGINVCKYYNEGECGWDEGLDVNCYADGREVFNLRKDGSDAEYDTQSVNKGLLHQLAIHMLVPSSESTVILTLLWQILCAPLLACSHWDEDKPRLGLGLPHRKDDPLIFRTLGTMFAKLADSVAGTTAGSTLCSQSRIEDAATSRFLSFVLQK